MAVGVTRLHTQQQRQRCAPAPPAPPAPPATHAPPHPPRTLCVLKSRLGARGVMEGATATAALSAAGLFV